MPTFQHLLDSLQNPQQHKQLRLQKIAAIETITGRPLIVYAAKRAAGFFIPNAIDDSDITGFSDLIEGITEKKLDVLLESPGGQAESTERIVNLLRENFEEVRFIIPHSAYSAATMLSLSGDQILIDDRSTLGPIDPQILISSPNGPTMAVPTQDILDAFKELRKTLKKEGAGVLPAYYPMIIKYDLHIFEICKKAQRLSTTLVQNWLQRFMFKNDPKRKQKGSKITKRFADRRKNLSHSRSLGVTELKQLGLQIDDLRNTPNLRGTVWELYCLIELFFDRTTAIKLFENSRGVSWSRNFQQFISIPLSAPQPPPQMPQQPPVTLPPASP